ncbi:MAG: outer membrane protein assembly factor BamA [Candidatus Delongbacteria bacterium]
MILRIIFILSLVPALILYPSSDMQALVDAPRISDIEFSGIYPFFSTELLDRMSIYPGSVFDEEKNELQKEYLRDYLKNKGYDSVRVEIVPESVTDKLILLNINIKKSDYSSIGKISFKGNRQFSDIRLKKEMKTWWRSWLTGQSGRLVPDELEKDIKKLGEFYRSRYFADAEISQEISAGNDRTSDIVIIVKEGPEYEIEVNGNHFYSDRALSEQTDLIKKSRNGAIAVRRMIRDIKKRYKEEGFNDVKVSWKDSLVNDVEDNFNMVDIGIIEGLRPIVAEINFKGNSSFSDKELETYLNSVVKRWWRFKEYFRKDMWEDDSRNVGAFYDQNGFLSAEAAGELKYSRGKDSVYIKVNVNEGTKTVIGSVTFEGSAGAVEKELKKIESDLKGKAYNRGMISEKTAQIKGTLATKGYIYAQVKDKTVFSDDSTTAEIIFNIDQKDIAETGRIYVTGNLKTKEKTVKKLLRLKEGEPFSILDLSEGLRSLRNQKIFRSVSSFTPGMETQKDTLDILISVEEYPPYYFQASGGYENFLGPYISLLAGNKNLFGKNKEVSLKTEASFVEQKVTGSFTEPVLFDPDLSGTVSAFWNREDNEDLNFESRTTGLSSGLTYKWQSSLQSMIQASVEHKELYEISSAGTDSNTVKNSGSLKLIQLWDRRDSFMVPRKGIYANFETEFSTGIDNKEDDFIKYALDLKYFFTPFGPVTFAFSGRLNYLRMTHPGTEPSVDQLFYLGGSSTVRGISDNSFLEDSAGDPMGGKLSALLTLEPRFEFFKNWELPLFLDTGLLSETAAGGGETLRSTAGTGLRYITPIGAMGLLWGFPLDVKDGWEDGVFHFSIGYTF